LLITNECNSAEVLVKITKNIAQLKSSFFAFLGETAYEKTSLSLGNWKANGERFTA
jgi:hypothetical protein